MNFDTLSSSVQVFATILMFVAGYLAFVVCAIVCAVLAELFLQGKDVAQAYAVRTSSLDNDTRCQVNRNNIRRSPGLALKYRH